MGTVIVNEIEYEVVKTGRAQAEQVMKLLEKDNTTIP